MNVFISWSGARSQAVAAAFREWLPLVVQAASPWFSPDDIAKGGRWLYEVNAQLSQQDIGIVCVTPENAQSPWLLFECGALSKAIDRSRVCPFLLGLDPADLYGPLAQFQATRPEKADVRKLLGNINDSCESPLLNEQLDTVYEALWPKFEAKLIAAQAMLSPATQPTRPQTEVLREILDAVRSVERHIASQPQSRLEHEMVDVARRLEEIGRIRSATVRVRRYNDSLAALRTRRDELQQQLETHEPGLELAELRMQLRVVASEVHALEAKVAEEARLLDTPRMSLGDATPR